MKRQRSRLSAASVAPFCVALAACSSDTFGATDASSDAPSDGGPIDGDANPSACLGGGHTFCDQFDSLGGPTFPKGIWDGSDLGGGTLTLAPSAASPPSGALFGTSIVDAAVINGPDLSKNLPGGKSVRCEFDLRVDAAATGHRFYIFEVEAFPAAGSNLSLYRADVSLVSGQAVALEELVGTLDAGPSAKSLGSLPASPVLGKFYHVVVDPSSTTPLTFDGNQLAASSGFPSKVTGFKVHLRSIPYGSEAESKLFFDNFFCDVQ